MTTVLGANRAPAGTPPANPRRPWAKAMAALMLAALALIACAAMPSQARAATPSHVLTWPAPGTYGIGYCFGSCSGYGGSHDAIDIAAPSGSKVVAAYKGTVTQIQYYGKTYGSYTNDYGNMLEIKHSINGQTVYTRYVHWNSTTVSVGSTVSAGQLVAYSGTSGGVGAHLDFKVIDSDGKTRLDPTNWLTSSGGTIYSTRGTSCCKAAAQRANNSGVKPSTPTGVSASSTAIAPGGSVTISWKAASNATGYVIDGWKDGKETHWIPLGNVTSYKISNLTEGTYSFYVIATNGSQSSSSSSAVKVTAKNITVGTPSRLDLSSSTINKGGSVTLTWSPTSNATGYVIDGWSNDKETHWIPLGNVTSYEIKNLPAGKYTFFLIATNGDFRSSGSARADLTVSDVKLPAPLNVKPSSSAAKPGTDITISWDVVEGATSYVIDGWKDGKETHWIPLGNVTSYKISGLTEGTYSFYVIAKNSQNDSPSSYPCKVRIGNFTVSPATNFQSSSEAVAPEQSVELTWDPSPNADYYVIDEWVNEKEYWHVLGDVTSYTASNLSEGTHSYFLYARIGDFRSEGCTLEVKAKNISLSTPTGVTLSRDKVNEGSPLTVSWNAVSGASRYDVCFSKDGRVTKRENVMGVAKCTIDDLEAGIYNVYVTAITGSFTSVASAEVPLNVFCVDGHKWFDWINSENLSCTTDGTRTGACLYCGYTEKSFVKAPGHREVPVEATAATRPGTICSICGETLSGCGAKLTQSSAKISTAAKKTVKGCKRGKLASTKTFLLAKTGVKGGAKITWAKSKGTSKITVSKGGKVSVKKGTKKGTYSLNVKLSIAQCADYKAKAIYKTIKVVVK